MTHFVTTSHPIDPRNQVVVWQAPPTRAWNYGRFLARILPFARTALTVWGGISLAAVGGYSLGAIVAPANVTPAQVAADAQITAAPLAAAAAEVTLGQAVPAPKEVSFAAVQSTGLVANSNPKPGRDAPAEKAAVTHSVRVASLPRPRPEPPIVTGSIKRLHDRDRRRQTVLRYGQPLDYYRGAAPLARAYPYGPLIYYER